MVSRTKALVAAATLVAAAMVPALAGRAAAASPCRAVPLGGPIQNSQPVLVAGAYTTAGATDVILTCGVVRNGFTIARVTDEMTGPVAAVEDVVHVSPGSVTSCYELRVRYLDRPSTYSDTCP
ncbi:MAG TPA: hypothetical protein VHJ76_01010 [Actinomycetota bacterium]|nr:hypothetical protein [Actinomycetota bacterium]